MQVKYPVGLVVVFHSKEGDTARDGETAVVLGYGEFDQEGQPIHQIQFTKDDYTVSVYQNELSAPQ